MNPSPYNKVYTVDALTGEIRKLLELSYSDIWVEGEVSSLSSPPSGHLYFTLKDDSSVLKCVLFKNRRYMASALPIEGQRFLLRGRVSVYTARGDVQMICSYIEAAGEGELRRRFEAMKNKLAAEGLFDSETKQPLPGYPREIALITSSHGAVLHDIISTLDRRYPLVRLKLLPVNVQGETAANEICEALKTAETTTADLIILARGGGSLEDLQPFNEESVARAVYDCALPVISAIGHETDFVISDFVADLRAPTPTAAATLATPDIAETRESLKQQAYRLGQQLQFLLNDKQQQLDLSAQKLKHPRDHLTAQSSLVNELSLRLNLLWHHHIERDKERLLTTSRRLLAQSADNRLNSGRLNLNTARAQLDHIMSDKLSRKQARLEQYRAALQAFNPRQTLARGYSILQNNQGEIVCDSDQVSTDESLRAHLHRGQLDVRITDRYDNDETDQTP